MHRGTAWLQRALDQPRVGFLVPAEGHNLDFRRRRFLRETVEMLAVAIEHGRAARLDTLEDFGLGIRDAVERLKIFQMHGRDSRDDRDLRAHELRQRADFAGMVHAHFENRVTRRHRAARERERHAPVIVVGRGRSMRRTLARQHELERFLGAGLADRAGDADHCRIGAVARSAAERTQSLEHVLDDNKRRVLSEQLRLRLRHDRDPGPGSERTRDKVVTVAITGDGKEGVARLQGAAVDREPADGGRHRPAHMRLHGIRHCLDGPQSRAHRTLSPSACATA